MGEAEMARVGELLGTVLRHRDDEAVLADVRAEVAEMCAKFDPYGSLGPVPEAEHEGDGSP
jgi:glycine/serine hydroxymethyltransferase